MERPPALPGLVKLIERLPPFHKVMERCMATMSKPYASAREIGGWIESDSALSGKVLSLANSSFYGQPNKVLQAERAVVLLGRRALEEVFFSFYIQGLFSSPDGSDQAELWVSSLSSGICAKELVGALGLPSSDGSETPDAGAYLAGLLHDSGKLLVLTHYPEYFHAAIRLEKEESLPECEAERRLWGFDHAELGQAMAAKWDLPENVCVAIACHHDPVSAGPFALLAALIRLSDVLCEAAVAGRDLAEAVRTDLDLDSRELLALEDARLPSLRRVVRTVREKMRVYEGLAESGTWQLG